MPIHAVILVLLLASPCLAQIGQQVKTWNIEGDEREAIVIAPSKAASEPAPVVFVFHGHGGNMKNSSRLGFQKHWPEAYIVCPQGLPTATGRDPEGKRSGWQPKLGDNGDRDIKFFDAILKTLTEEKHVDVDRVYVTGHSNGGGFTYTLLVARGTKLAAIAPSAAGSSSLRTPPGDVPQLPIMHIAGKTDLIVPFEAQERTMLAIRKLNQCESVGKAYGKMGELIATAYPSAKNCPVVTVIHPDGHKYPERAPEMIVGFLKEQKRVSKEQ